MLLVITAACLTLASDHSCCQPPSHRRCWQLLAAYLSYTLRMKTLFRGWPVMVHDTHTRRRRTECDRRNLLLTTIVNYVENFFSRECDCRITCWSDSDSLWCWRCRRQPMRTKMKTKSEETGRASWTFCCRQSASLSVSATSGDFRSALTRTAVVGIYVFCIELN